VAPGAVSVSRGARESIPSDEADTTVLAARFARPAATGVPKPKGGPPRPRAAPGTRHDRDPDGQPVLGHADRFGSVAGCPPSRRPAPLALAWRELLGELRLGRLGIPAALHGDATTEAADPGGI